MQTFEKKNYKNYKLLGTDSVRKNKKEFCDTISIITLYCVSVVISYSVYL